MPMTDQDMEKVAKICLTADSWCSNCQHEIFDELRKAFPDKLSVINSVWGRRSQIYDEFFSEYRKWDYGNGTRSEPQVWDYSE